MGCNSLEFSTPCYNACLNCDELLRNEWVSKELIGIVQRYHFQKSLLIMDGFLLSFGSYEIFRLQTAPGVSFLFHSCSHTDSC